MAGQFYKKYTKQEIRAAFEHFDKDGSGTISAEELHQVLNKMGRNYSSDEIDAMIARVDADGSGTISIDEFTELLN